MSEDERLVRHHLRPAPDEAETALDRLLAAAEARGYERAREQAAKKADDYSTDLAGRGWSAHASHVRATAELIRAMTDERAEGEAKPKSK